MVIVNDWNELRRSNDPNKIIVRDGYCEMDLYIGKTSTICGKALFDVDLLPMVRDRKWHISMYGYVASHQPTKGDKRLLFMHHLVLSLKVGYVTDHINGNRKDNRKANLRYATHAQNHWNDSSIIGPIGVKGVSYDKDTMRYRARVWCNNTLHQSPRFDTLSEATEWVRNKREQLHGDFVNHGNSNKNLFSDSEIEANLS